MSFLARFRWWRKLHGGTWECDHVTGKHWNQLSQSGLENAPTSTEFVPPDANRQIADLRRQLNDAQARVVALEQANQSLKDTVEKLDVMLLSANKKPPVVRKRRK
jgi:hypothetical protein